MKKTIKRILLVLLSLVLVLALTVGGYVLYIALQYSRIADKTSLVVQNPQSQRLRVQEEYIAATYNIGFGAYNHEFSFFMDTGVMLDGTPVAGKFARAQSKQIVMENTAGAEEELKALEPDFCLLQEVDVKADRSWKINQVEEMQKVFPGYASVYASNFHSAYLAYPLHEPHGAVEAGLLTLSKYEISAAERRSYPVDTSFPTKFFDLDRCFSVLRLPVEGGGELVLANSHMSAYDEGGTIRAAQMQMLVEFMQEEYAKGNWVIIGGDFNHALGGQVEQFSSGQIVPGWVYPFDTSALPEGFSVVQADNAAKIPTCRSSDIPYQKGVNYVSILDGFIVSSNVAATTHNIDADFVYSDHNPVQLTFSLNQTASLL